MEETHRRTVSRFSAIGRILSRILPRILPRIWVAGALAAFGAGACTGRYAGPRTLASAGTLTVLAGGATWAVGESFQRNGHPDAANMLVGAGFASVAAGIAAIVAAGGWMAGAVRCDADPDCAEDEQCREIPAPPGGVPYKQCMAR
jgi:hypothetical protein